MRSRVIFADTDAGGAVYFGSYCRYMEMGVGEWFLEFAKPLKEICESNQVCLVMSNVKMQYLSPLHYNDQILIRTGLKKTGQFSISFRTNISVADVECFVGENTMVTLDSSSGKVVALPQDILSVTR